MIIQQQRDQLRAQRSVTSMGKLYLFTAALLASGVTMSRGPRVPSYATAAGYDFCIGSAITKRPHLYYVTCIGLPTPAGRLHLPRSVPRVSVDSYLATTYGFDLASCFRPSFCERNQITRRHRKYFCVVVISIPGRRAVGKRPWASCSHPRAPVTGQYKAVT